jgi:hypothetical protein
MIDRGEVEIIPKNERKAKKKFMEEIIRED